MCHGQVTEYVGYVIHSTMRILWNPYKCFMNPRHGMLAIPEDGLFIQVLTMAHVVCGHLHILHHYKSLRITPNPQKSHPLHPPPPSTTAVPAIRQHPIASL